MKGNNLQRFFEKYSPMMIIGALFFVFGFITWVNSVLIPYFQIICELSVQQAMLVTFAFYLSYLVMAFPSSYILKKTGYRKGMMLGLFIMAAGAMVFIPAANSRTYFIFLLGLFIQATGLTLLQTAANPYVTILGPIESAASRISLMGVCNKVAGALAPLILVGAVVRNPNEIDEVQQQVLTATAAEQNAILDALSQRLIVPYLVVGLVLIVLGMIIKFTKLPDVDDKNANAAHTPLSSQRKMNLLSHKNLVYGAIALFCAVGVEVLVIDSIINYAQNIGYSFREAKYFATYTLLIMIVSYLIGIVAIPRIISQRKTLMVSAFIGIGLSILAVIVQGPTSVWFIAFMGLGNALLWPAIWPLSLAGLGLFTSKGSALLVMGAVGGAVVPLLYGIISDATNLQIAYLVLIPFYLYILFFSVSGYKSIKTEVEEKLNVKGDLNINKTVNT